MTLRIHAPNPLRVGETANVLVTSDNRLCQGLPGVYRVHAGDSTRTQVGTGQFPSCTSIDVQVGIEYDEEA